jgi:hypothetical protein
MKLYSPSEDAKRREMSQFRIPLGMSISQPLDFEAEPLPR